MASLWLPHGGSRRLLRRSRRLRRRYWRHVRRPENGTKGNKRAPWEHQKESHGKTTMGKPQGKPLGNKEAPWADHRESHGKITGEAIGKVPCTAPLCYSLWVPGPGGAPALCGATGGIVGCPALCGATGGIVGCIFGALGSFSSALATSSALWATPLALLAACPGNHGEAKGHY